MEHSNKFSILHSEVSLDSGRIAKKREKNVNKEKVTNGYGTSANEPKKAKSQPKIQVVNTNVVNNNKVKKKKNEAELLALAFGIGKSKGKKNVPTRATTLVQEEPPQEITKKKGKKNTVKPLVNGTLRHEDSWKKHDEEFVRNQNEQTLQEAIMMSRLDFEECKSKQKPILKQKFEKPKIEIPEKIRQKEVKIKKKKDKPLTISLDEFNSLKPKELAKMRDPKPAPVEKKPKSAPAPPRPPKAAKEKFFQEVEDAAKSTLIREKTKENYKATITQQNQEMLVKRLKSEIEKRDFEIQALRLEEEALRVEMKAVKTRNKKLCDVISVSELRSKGELVIELEKVNRARDEFSEEVATISAELEQEKTKVSNLTQELKKIQGKKRSGDSTSK